MHLRKSLVNIQLILNLLKVVFRIIMPFMNPANKLSMEQILDTAGAINQTILYPNLSIIADLCDIQNSGNFILRKARFSHNSSLHTNGCS